MAGNFAHSSICYLQCVKASSLPLAPFRQLSYGSARSSRKTKLCLMLPLLGLTACSYICTKKRSKTTWSTRLCTAATCQSLPTDRTKRFSGKVVLITGAAGDIGGTTAKKFVKEGALVVLSDLPETERK